MTTAYIKYWLTLGLAGFLAVSIPSAAKGEIPVTGGRTAGDGAFFVPTQGNTLLFDTNTRFLRLETPNGVTVNSRFRPGSGRLDPFTGVPQGGETGFLEGTLSGRAFTPEGTPFFFQGVSTTLNFTLTSFETNRLVEGTLIRPNGQSSTPLVFLEATGTSLSDPTRQNFEAIPGNLHIGEFSANLSGGAISLPGDTQFAAPGTEVIQFDGNTLAANANTKFELEGSGKGTTTLDAGQGTISYDGQSGTTNFTIQGTIDGTPDNSSDRASQVSNTQNQNSESNITVDDNSFKIEGTIQGPVNFVVGGVGDNGAGANQVYTGDTQYQVSGVGRGSTEFNRTEGSLNFYSPESNTNVEITGNGFAVQGTGTGEVSLSVGVGLTAAPGSSAVSSGAVFGSSPTPTSTDFGRGFSGLSLAPRRTGTSSSQVVVNDQTTTDPTRESASTGSADDSTKTGQQPQIATPSIVLPSGPLPDTDSPLTISPQPQPEVQPQPQPQPQVQPQPQPQPQPQVQPQPQPQPQPEVQPQPQPQPEVQPQPQPQPELQPQPQPEVQPQPQPQPEVTTPQSEPIVRQDPLAALIEQIRHSRSQPDDEPLPPSFSESVESQLRSVSGPRSRVFPGMESLR